jgi:ABC-type protease/lipase transport system fused ATPase/permease subunit
MGLAAVSRALRLLIQSGMLALGAWLVIRGEIGAGVMIAASIVLGRALQPIEMAITNWRAYQRYRLARKRLREALRETAGERRPETPPELKPKGALEVRALYAAPPGQRDPFLKNIGFGVPAGSILLVIGANGSGKTMLARLLAGVWRPLDGEILLDGADLRVWPRETLGRITGYVPQNVELLDGSIAENIARLDPEPDPEAVIRAAKAAGVHEEIKRMGGYDREVGPMGAFLSAGQRQRVALARALYGDPVLVILDEPRNGLDQAGVGELMRTLMRLKKDGRTVVLVEHDERFMKLADYVLLLHEGQVRIGGPRDKVLAAMTGKRRRPATAVKNPGPAGAERPGGRTPKDDVGSGGDNDGR